MYHTPRSHTEIRSRNRRLRTKETEPHPAGYGPDMIMQRGVCEPRSSSATESVWP